ncbi:MAG: cytochrome c oxidase subunit II [Chloroflexi bacterium]|nr:cytochrome c oxidase subunit II [Chloroflexota bacterium]
MGRPVRFEITATDVIHSFWVPSFRTKIDAVPGMITVVYATPDRTGSFQEDYHFRVQCAELCGLGHGIMATPVVVVEPSQFEAWAAQQAGGTR